MTEQAQPQGAEVTSLGEFILRVQGWHANRVQSLQHFMTIPDNGEVTIEFEGRDLKLEGDVLLAFRAGIASSLDALGTLPFVAIEEEPEAAAEQPAPEILGVESHDGA